MKTKIKKQYCDNFDEHDYKGKHVAKFRCELCNGTFCKKCEEMFFGECPQCPPPRLFPIK